MRKISRIITITFAAFIMLVSSAYVLMSTKSINEDFNNLYTNLLNQLKNDLLILKKDAQKNSVVTNLQDDFFTARCTYKKLAIFTEYFNIYDTKFINYPAIDRVEEDHPDRVIPPSGFQAIEQLLFSDWQYNSYKKLDTFLDQMFVVIDNLKNEKERLNKFRDYLVWDALRISLIKIITIEITGFDSPIAQYSITESKATLEGIKHILDIFQNNHKKNNSDFASLFSLLNKSYTYLNKHNNFDKLNRSGFIINYLNPLYKEIIITRNKLGITFPDGINPINLNAESLFDTGAFNINFFSPGKNYYVTPDRINLGKKLFFDPILSENNSRNCASCHQPAKAFTDGVATPYALDKRTLLLRNTPTLWNSGLQTRQFMDSRTDILENQLDEVVHNEKEMKGSLIKSATLLKNSKEYFPLFQKAYSNEKEPVTPFNIANAISSYIRSLISMNSRFDKYMRGEKNMLSKTEIKGFNLFTGKAKCATCHFMPLFNGLAPPFFTETESEVLGVPATKKRNPSILDEDLGKNNFTKSVIHKHSFKTPTLRNVALTAPYMHNGVFTTLEEVMDFYNNGGGKGLFIAPPNQTLPFDKLSLSKKEIKAVIAFMQTLTDTTSLYK